MSRLEKEQNFSFHFVDAPVVTEPHESVAAFSSDPCYRFFHWAPSKIPFNMEQVRAGYEFIYKVIEEQGPFDGVMGFSQGAAISLSFIMHHAELHPEEESRMPFRFMVLFSCPYLPPKDEDGSIIPWGKTHVPSLHLVGQEDEEWFEGGMATYKDRCEGGSASLIVHGGGHAVPKDKPTVDKTIQEIKTLLRRAGFK